MLRSIEPPTFVTIVAVTPIGSEPITKPPEPLRVTYLISGNCPNWGKASAMLTETAPLTVKAPVTFMGAEVGLPKPPRSKSSDDDAAAVRLAAVNWALAVKGVTL